VPDDGQGWQGSEAAHQPVLLAEAVAQLAPRPGLRFLDCTIGLGGHAEALLERGGRLMGVDRDPQAREAAYQRLGRFGDAFRLRGGTFAEAAEGLILQQERFDGLIADLGVSSMQIDRPERGFSIRSEASLDLRMGEGAERTALQLIEQSERDELADLLWRYGELRQSRRLAGALQDAARRGERSAEGFAAVVRRALPGRHRRHPAIRVFQALRIAVNDELGELQRLLDCFPKLLGPGACAVFITFHSLEDRLVKQRLRALHETGELSGFSRKVVKPSAQELAENRRAASAKLRWCRT